MDPNAGCRFIWNADHHATGKPSEFALESLLFAFLIPAILLKHSVDLVNRTSIVELILRIPNQPSSLESVVGLAASFGTRSVTCGNGGCFIKKEQFGVLVGSH